MSCRRCQSWAGRRGRVGSPHGPPPGLQGTNRSPLDMGCTGGPRGEPRTLGVLGGLSPLPGDLQLISGTEQAWGVRGKGCRSVESVPRQGPRPQDGAVPAECGARGLGGRGRLTRPGFPRVMWMDAGWRSSWNMIGRQLSSVAKSNLGGCVKSFSIKRFNVHGRLQSTAKS